MENCFLYSRCNHIDCDKSFCLRKYKLDYLYKNSLLSISQREPKTLYIDSDGTDREAFTCLVDIEKNILNFVRAGNNLFIHSYTCGNGKTSWAVRLIQAYFNNIWPKTDLDCKALFISVPKFLLALKDNISNKNEYASFILNNVEKADLVVWDDIATKTGTEFELNRLLAILDDRLCYKKSNIFTSNLGESELETALGPRLASRILGLSKKIELFGADKRSLNS